MPTINEEFQKYRNACYGNEPLTETQAGEVKQALFAGAHIVLTAVLEMNKLPVEVAKEQFEALVKEIEDENNKRISELVKRGIIAGNQN